MKMKTIIPLAAAAVICAMPLKAKAGSFELMAGDKNTTIDVKAAGDISKSIGYFARLRPSFDYKGGRSSFGVVDITVPIGSGINVVTELQMFGGSVVPRMGLDIFRKFGDLSIYSELTMGMDKNPYLESLTWLQYSPKLYRDIMLSMRVENITDFASKHEWSTQRIRIGVSKNGWIVGAAADLSETGSNGAFGYNIGGFVSKGF